MSHILILTTLLQKYQCKYPKLSNFLGLGTFPLLVSLVLTCAVVCSCSAGGGKYQLRTDLKKPAWQHGLSVPVYFHQREIWCLWIRNSFPLILGAIQTMGSSGVKSQKWNEMKQNIWGPVSSGHLNNNCIFCKLFPLLKSYSFLVTVKVQKLRILFSFDALLVHIFLSWCYCVLHHWNVKIWDFTKYLTIL